MPVVCLGISHRTAPVAVREEFAFSQLDREHLYSTIVRSDLESRTGIAELAVLSTCNRVEMYAGTGNARRADEVAHALNRLLSTRLAKPRRDLHEYSYTLRDSDAVRHLSRVAAGLESLVIGESEILGQVRVAYEHARARKVTGPALDALFRSAISTARRARSHTAIGRRPASVSSEAIRIAEQMGAPLNEKRILIVGAGKMSRRAAKILCDKGACDPQIIGRTRSHVARLANEVGAIPLGWHQLGDAIALADIVITSTGAPHPVISRDLVEIAVSQRHGAQLLFVDVAVPRDVEPSVSELPGVRVVDIDDLQSNVEQHLARRMEAIPVVEEIVDAGVLEYEEQQRIAEVRPLLSAFRSQVEYVRQRELHRSLDNLRHAQSDVAEELERLSRSLTNELLRVPMHRVRYESDPARRRMLQDGMRQLFNVED